MQYPSALTPSGAETVALPSGRVIRIPKATPRFRRWTGSTVVDTYGGKAVVDLDGEPLFAELATLRLLQRDGWDGVWIDTFRSFNIRYTWSALSQGPCLVEYNCVNPV